MEDLIQLFKPLIREEVTFELNKALSDKLNQIVTDKTKLMQVFYNLLSIANKFTFKGKIRVGYKLNNKTLEFFIEDTGIGIDYKYHQIIFERFNKSI